MLLQSFGAEVITFSKETTGFHDSIQRAEELARVTRDGFLPSQFSNKDNPTAHYTTTGPEIWYQLKAHSLRPDAFVAGVGTGGTVMGVGRFLKERNKTVKIHPLEPTGFPLRSAVHTENGHRIKGIADGYLPPILDLKALDTMMQVEDGDAIMMAQKLASELGLGVGISSGANFLGALMVQEYMANDAVVVTIFPDDNKKYLSTDLFREEPAKRDFLAPHISLLELQSLQRMCSSCCAPKE